MNGYAIGKRREMEFAAILRKRGLRYVYHPQGFVLKKKKWPTRYQPDFFVPTENKYYEVIGSRQRLRDNGGAFLRKIQTAERIYGIRVDIVKPDGSPYPRFLHRGDSEERRGERQRVLSGWDESLTLRGLCAKLGKTESALWSYKRKFKLKNRLGKRPARLFTYKGVSLSIRDWEMKMGFNKGALGMRLWLGWPLAKALETPMLPQGQYERTEEWKKEHIHLSTHCKDGHPRSGDNLYVSPNGNRHCRICGRRRAKKYYRAKKAAACRG